MFRIIILLAIGYCGNLAAQITANATLEPARIETGDTFRLRILVSGTTVAPKSVRLEHWSPMLPGDNILASSDFIKSGSQWVKKYTLIAFDSALLTLPPVEVITHLGDTVRTNELELIVEPTASSTNLADMEPLRDIRTEPGRWYDHWPWLVLAMLLMGAGWWWYRRNRPAKVVVQAPPTPQPVDLTPQKTPQELALERLAAIQPDGNWKNIEVLPFYAELSLIVRTYIETQFNVPALESTTREWMPKLSKTAFPSQLTPTLRDWLQRTEKVKFADHKPDEQHHQKTWQQAVSLVRGQS